MTDLEMSDTRRMLAEMADPLFAELGPDAPSERALPQLEELGLPLLLVPEPCRVSLGSEPGRGSDSAEAEWSDQLSVPPPDALVSSWRASFASWAPEWGRTRPSKVRWPSSMCGENSGAPTAS